jgi:beta-phosphoglucomutase
MTRIEAIIFDFDGVIARTLEDSCSAWLQACTEYNLPFDREEFLLAEGRKSTEYITTVLLRHGMQPSLAKVIAERKNQIYGDIHSFSFYEGVERFIEELLAHGVKTAVVSGGSRARLLKDPSGALLRTLDCVVTGDDVARGKPDPEIFLRASAALRVPPERCLVIENAPLGITAAKNAGMQCLAVCSTLPAFRLMDADDIFPSIADLAAHVSESLSRSAMENGREAPTNTFTMERI